MATAGFIFMAKSGFSSTNARNANEMWRPWMYGKDTPSEDNDVVRPGRKKTSLYLEHEGTISTEGSLVVSLVIRETPKSWIN